MWKGEGSNRPLVTQIPRPHNQRGGLGGISGGSHSEREQPFPGFLIPKEYLSFWRQFLVLSPCFPIDESLD